MNKPPHSVGPLAAPTITVAVDGSTCDVTSCEAFLYSTGARLSGTNFTGDYRCYKVAAATGLVLTGNPDSNYLVIDYNSGTPQYAITTDPATIDGSSRVLVANMYRDGADVHYIAVDWGKSTANRVVNRLINTGRFERSSGLSLSGIVATLEFTVGSGVIWYGPQSFPLASASSTSSNADVFYRDGGGNWVHATVSGVDTTYYDSPTGRVALTNNDYGVRWIYRFIDGAALPKLAIIYGTASHANLANAVAELVATPPTILQRQAILVGRIIVRQGATTYIQVDSAFTQVFAGSTVTSHSILADRDLADQHPQNSITGLTTSSSPTFNGLNLTGDLDLNSNDLLEAAVTATGSSVARTLETRFGERVNVKDFGAVGDGVTEDTTAINAAITYVNGRGGGEVFFPAGTYLTGQVLIKTKVKLAGESRTSTTIKAKANLDTDVIKVSSSQDYWYGMRDITVDGNKANQTGGTTGAGCRFTSAATMTNPDGTDSPNCEFMNVWAINCKGHGFWIGEYGMGGHSFYNCVAYLCDKAGFEVECPDSYYYNCVAANCGSYGFAMRSANNLLSGCKTFLSGRVTNGEGDGFYIRAPRNQLVGCIGQDNYRFGLYMYSSGTDLADRTVVTNFTADSNNRAGYDWVGGIGLDSSSYVYLTGLSYNRTGQVYQRYGLVVADTNYKTSNCEISLSISQSITAGMNIYSKSFLNLNRVSITGDAAVRNDYLPYSLQGVAVVPPVSVPNGPPISVKPSVSSFGSFPVGALAIPANQHRVNISSYFLGA
jgi:hypothetical protein